ncbi:predicted protein [Sclerotinia sclerotiorum 1980 UF-70]|uniref:Hydrophobin n=2 Tax=Sclerotinia sclerotiorum (strain ATCC 18683 / 1980 / Ss-1) TaxID=665079 RepID=A7F3P9_SCLS1|nr:predicted protein [Sclerotinia sclerotiorum 1980 UF-70]APA14292.1 hypothetical protein sscle_12g090620 [Sclerotinia sclerotiorum 1980 UF-70]EDN97370.1 predicted protein [Sclerotinia sclerotiorum 1980 UF-70]
MRFTIATAILSSAAMVVAIPTTESTLFGRSGGQTCAQGQTLQCCQSVTAAGDGILGNLLGLNCADIPIPILGVILGGKCNSAPVCCNVNGGDTSGGINILTNSCVAVPIVI